MEEKCFKFEITLQTYDNKRQQMRLISSVDASCCAGVTPEKHLAMLETMRSCKEQVLNG